MIMLLSIALFSSEDSGEFRRRNGKKNKEKKRHSRTSRYKKGACERNRNEINVAVQSHEMN